MTAMREAMMPAIAAPVYRPGRPDWAQDGKDWPNRAASRFFVADGIRWHVQIAGAGPVLLLLHGTGAATHSWRDLVPILARDFTVVAPDLPGHGFTEAPPAAAMSLPGMADGVAALLAVLGLAPALAAGHSAGAAILVRMCLERQISPRGLISLNGALRPFQHAISPLFAPMAKLFARTPVVPFIFSLHATDPKIVERLIHGTGSTIDAAGLTFYGRLARRTGHAGAALTMMANWDLAALQPRLSKFSIPLLLVTGENDRSIPPADADYIRRLVPGARVVKMPGLGHLAHEERPVETARLISDFFAEHGR